jgi:hypothetical protein
MGVEGRVSKSDQMQREEELSNVLLNKSLHAAVDVLEAAI